MLEVLEQWEVGGVVRGWDCKIYKRYRVIGLSLVGLAVLKVFC